MFKTARDGAPDIVSRPRAGRYTGAMNYWFWLYIVLVPAIVFSAKPQTPQWWRIARLPLAIAACYLLINLAVDLKWEFRNAEINAIPNPSQEDLSWAAADGANIVFTLLLGWIPAATYTGWWEMAWRLFYRKKLTGRKLRLRFSSGLIGFSLIVSLLASLDSISLGYPRGIKVFFHHILPPWLDVFYR